MTSERKPRLSIGVPVYNGARFLRATLDSILAQTFTDFELIICDNCSNDATDQICRDYAARDPRIRYFRNDRNIGPAPNYNRCFDLARGELFKWSAADDVIAPTFLERCIAELDRDPSLSGVYSKTREIDADGRELFDHQTEPDLAAPTASRRFLNYIFVNHRHHAAQELWGVYRSDVLRRWSPLKGSFPSADRLVVVRAALHGPVGRVEEFLFFNRDHGNRSVRGIMREKVRPGSRLVRYIGCGPTPSYEWWDETKKGKIVFPEWRWLLEYYKAAIETPLPPAEKFKCALALAGLTIKYLPRLARDLIIAAELLFYRFTGLSPKPTTSPPRPEVVSPKPAGQ